MARKGQLAPQVKLVAYLANTKNPRCQFVKFPVGEAKYGEQCKKSCEPGRPRCKYHGGRAGRPVITGKHSKYNPVPTNLREKFERAAEDPDILDLTKKIALLDAQIWNLAETASSQKDFDDFQVKKLLTLINQQRQLIGQETERRIAMGSMVDAGTVALLIGYIFDSILKNVSDERTRRIIGADLRKIVGTGLVLAERAVAESATDNVDTSLG